MEGRFRRLRGAVCCRGRLVCPRCFHVINHSLHECCVTAVFLASSWYGILPLRHILLFGGVDFSASDTPVESTPPGLETSPPGPPRRQAVPPSGARQMMQRTWHEQFSRPPPNLTKISSTSTALRSHVCMSACVHVRKNAGVH